MTHLQYRHTAWILLLFFLWVGIGHSQENTSGQDDPIVIDLNQIENDGKRVEVQRYIGYENLFFRYLTLPYDVSINISDQGRYFDIGYPLLILVPIAILFLLYRMKKAFYVVIAISLIYLFICFSFSYIKFDSIGSVRTSDTNWSTITQNADKTFSESILWNFYRFSQGVTTPLQNGLNAVTGQSDHVTYPLLLVLLVLTISGFFYVFRKKPISLAIGLTLLVYFFLWLLLSGGIIWYGFLILPILTIFSLKFILHSKKNSSSSHQLIKWLSLATLGFWVILAYAARVGNIDFFTPEEHMGKALVDSKLIYYSAGIHSASQARDFVYNNIGNTLDRMNENDGLIYQVGTSMTFDISNNPKRIYQDNILIDFFDLINKYREPTVIMDVLKASDFKYIVIDLYTPTLDKTPEKSLTKKYQLLLNTLYNNNRVNLLATDRIIQVKRANGQTEVLKDVFVPDYQASDQVKIQTHGSYAIYEIL